MTTKVSRANWRHMSTNKKRKRLIPKKSSLLAGRTLINQTEQTRSVWDKGNYQSKKFYDNMYRSI